MLALTWYGWRYVGDPDEGLTTTRIFDGEEVHAVPLDGAVDLCLLYTSDAADE